MLTYQPITLAKVTRHTVNSCDASNRTLRRRSDELNQHRLTASGGATVVQLRDELKSLPVDQRQTLLTDLEFKIEIPAITSLALKSNLCLPWNKMRNMKRYHKQTKRSSFDYKYCADG